jgi:streptogramin lyase
VSREGELHVVDMLNFRVQVFDAQGRLVRFFGEAGAGFPGQFDKIHAVGFDTFGNVYVTDAVQGIHVLNPDAQALMIFGAPVARAPSAIVVDSKNTIYVGDLLFAVHEFQLINTKAEDSYVKPKAPAAKPAGSVTPAAAPRR